MTGAFALSGGEVTRRTRRLMLAVALVSQTLVLLDNTIVNVAVEVLADPVRGLGAGTGELAWAVSAYPLVFAAVTLAGGALTDRFGVSRVLLPGLGLLGAASAAAAISPDGVALIAARAVMGAGGGLIAPATLTLVTAGLRPDRRARAVALWSSAAGVAVAVGPVLGGLLLARFAWQAVFLVNIPIVSGLLLAGAFLPRLPAPGRLRPLDLRGAALAGLGLAVLVGGIVQCGREASAPALLVVAAGMALLALFAWYQSRARNPAFDVRLLLNRGFGRGVLGLLLSFAGLAGQLFYCAFFLQGVRHLTPDQAGFVMFSAAAGIVIGNRVCSGAAERFGARTTVLTGLVTASLTYASYLLFDERTLIAWIIVMLFIQGFGAGLAFAPLTSRLVGGLPDDRVGAGAALVTVTRPLGSTIGVAVLGSVLTLAYGNTIRPALNGLPGPAAERARDSAESARAVAADLGRPELAAAADAAYVHAMHVTAGWATVLSLAGCAVVAPGLRRIGEQWS
ncbi:MFS transporter [Amycolatopsis alba]|uniref:MFS transporter n=1 Tax=Amycolatopsis alba DSM 44262 TaxID=1125972 RepID=A0A229S7M6_AMYAL|nr:MFS transporter [Amycolatopsis alba]OXM54937.1 MFS transporter [Amycolatopsis alba DSM 44262]